MIHVVLGAMAVVRVTKHVHKAMTNHIGSHAARHGAKVLTGVWMRKGKAHMYMMNYLAKQAADSPGGITFK